MKKLLPLLISVIFLAAPLLTKAQCYGVVHYDTHVNANGATTCNITTTYCNELIMIAYDGWSQPGAGPVKVDGNNATHVVTGFDNNNSGIAESYAYIAATAGTHTITCTETNYSYPPYGLNMAASFYLTGTTNPFNIASFTSTVATITCVTGGTINGTITTTIPGSMIYGNWENNNGQGGPFTDNWTGATKLDQQHEGNGIDASQAYEPAPTPGAYPVTVSNNANPSNGCGGLVITLVDIPPPICAGGGGLTASATVVEPTCGNCNGSISINVSGGSAPYTYNWTPPVTTNSSASGLCAGTYSINVEDHSCPPKDTLIVVTLVGNTITVNANNTGNEPCNGECVGSANCTVIGGTAPYTYAWTPSGGSNSSANGLCAGTYTVTVHDHAGCTGTATVTITQPAILTAPITVSNILCFGGGTGSETCTPVGGTAPYTYSWTPVASSNATVTGLSVGCYTVTVTDINGCTATNSACITQPTQVIATMGTPVNALCNGGTGSINVTATGGTPNYTYLWNPGGSTSANATGLSAGCYTVTVHDANGCSATGSACVSQPNPVTAIMNPPTYPLCNGGTGTATVTPGGGTPNYTYLWTPSGGINPTGTGLTAGSFTVTVTDHNGCTASASVTITQPSLLSVTASFTHASCNLPNGSATANPNGGVGPYSYIWVPSAETNATATGLTAGCYTVTIHDANACTSSTSVCVTQPSAVTASITTTTGVSCNGGSNGTATGLATGGSGPYNYLWTPGGNTNSVATGLAANTYTLTITDANGCTSSAAATITEPTPLKVVGVTGPTIVCLGSSGAYTVTATGGTLPYAYVWSNGATTSTASIQPPSPQTYSVVVTDANGCTASGQISINFGPPLIVTTSGNTSLCAGASTTLCANLSGGTGGDTYLWQPGALTSPCITITPTLSTIYTLTVVDNCGAVVNVSTPINVNAMPTVDMSADVYTGCNPLCIQFRNASTVQGTAAQYVWNFGDRDSLISENPIYCYHTNGSFNVTLTVTSDSGCSSTLKRTGLITVYSRPAAAFTYSPQAISILTPTVQFTDQTKDQSNIVSWAWNFGDDNATSKVENPSHTYQDTGSFCASLTVMNAHGCTDTITNCLVIAPAYTLYIPSAFSPNGDGVNDVFQPVGKYIKSFEMYIFDRWGMQLYHTTDITQGWKGNVNGGSNVAQEETYIYKIMVTDAQGVTHNYTGNVSIIK